MPAAKATVGLPLLDRAAVIARADEHIPDNLNVTAHAWADHVEIGVHADRIYALHLAQTLQLRKARNSPGLTTTWEGHVTLNGLDGQPRRTVPLQVVHYPVPASGKKAAA